MYIYIFIFKQYYDLKSHSQQYVYFRDQTKCFFSLLNKSSHMKQSINSRNSVTNGSTFYLFTAVKRFIFIV